MIAITAPWPANTHDDYYHFQSVDAMSSAPSRSAAVGRAGAFDLPLGALSRGSDDRKIEHGRGLNGTRLGVATLLELMPVTTKGLMNCRISAGRPLSALYLPKRCYIYICIQKHTVSTVLVVSFVFIER